MSLPSIRAWQEMSQRHLLGAVAAIREQLERCGGAQARDRPGDLRESSPLVSPPSPGPGSGLPGGPAGGPTSALDQLCATFDMSSFERQVLVLCAGMVLDARIGPLCAAAQNAPDLAHPSFGLALRVLPEPDWSALLPDARLRHWRLVELGAGGALTAAPLRIDEWALHWLMGMPHMDARLVPLLERVEPGRFALPPSHEAVAAHLVSTWRVSAERAASLPVIQLLGDASGAPREIAARACARLGLALHALDARALPAGAAESDEFVRLWQRQTLLDPAVLLVEGDGLEGAEAGREAAITRLLEGCEAPLLLAGTERRRAPRRPLLTLEIEPPTSAEKLALWQEALGPAAATLGEQLPMLAAQFHVGPAAIHAVAAEALVAGGDLGAALWQSCRRQARPRLGGLAERIEPGASWEDLALPEAQLGILRDIVAHVRQRATVQERWGFGRKGRRGLGVSALFAGPSGTGKTFAAEVLASELGLDLYRIDLSAVVSKYIGETEKNLARVFDAAEAGGAILLCDEADALFGKRSEVKDSHDRHANIEVSYLLQRMEAYRGLAILTTNLKEALDPAFLRRLGYVVRFTFPDAAQRAALWRRVFPRETPLAELDFARLAQLNVSGAHIRNIALRAAFLAAEAGEPVGMQHLRRAAASEFLKLERAFDW